MNKMYKNSLIAVLCFCVSVFSLNAQKLIDLDVSQAPKKEDGHIYRECSETKWGVLVFSSGISGLQFSLSLPDNLNQQVYNPERNEYVLCVVPTDRRYVVTITCSDCEPVNYTVEDIKANDPQFFRISRKHTPPVKITPSSRELSFYFAGGYENIAGVEHEDIPIDVILRRKIPETSTYTDKNGKTQTRTTTKNEDRTIASFTLSEGFSVKIDDPRSEQYEVILRRKCPSLNPICIATGRLGDNVVKQKTEKLQSSMYKRTFEYTLKKTEKGNKRKGNIVYTYEFVVK